MKIFNKTILLLILSLAVFSSCSKKETPAPDPEPAEVKISEEGVRFVGEATDGAIITLQIYDNKLKLVLDNAAMYPDNTLNNLYASCFTTAKFGLVISGTTVNGSTIDISCPVPNTPPTDEERLNFGFTDTSLPEPSFDTAHLCNGGVGPGLRYDALKDLTDLPVLGHDLSSGTHVPTTRYCLGTDNKTYKVIINELGGLGLYFPSRFNFLNRTINGVISIIDTNNEALNLIIKEL